MFEIKKKIECFDDIYDIVCNGSKDVMDVFSELDKESEFFEYFDDCCSEGIDLDNLDDIIRFDNDSIREYCGITEDEFCKFYNNKR